MANQSVIGELALGTTAPAYSRVLSTGLEQWFPTCGVVRGPLLGGPQTRPPKKVEKVLWVKLNCLIVVLN